VGSVFNRITLWHQEKLGDKMADTKIIVNCETGEVSEVELTAAEVKQREADAIAYAKAKADEEQAAAEKAEAKAAIAERLGLTDAELAILLA